MAESLAAFTFSPGAVGTSQTTPFLVVPKGTLLVACYAQVLTPSDSGSSGVISFSSDANSRFTGSITPSSDLLAAGAIKAASLLSATGEINVSDETVSLVWTPGGSPGVTSPVVAIKTVSDRIF